MPTKQKDGRYRAKITIGATADGKPIVKYVSGGTKRELEEAKQAARTHYIDGADIAQDRQFGEYVVAWYNAIKKPKLSASSKVNYLVYINKDIIPAFGERMLRSIRPLEIQNWLNAYAGKSKSMLTLLLGVMRGVYASALAEGIVQRDPTATVRKPEAKKPKEKRALTEEERARIETTIDRHRHGLLLSVLYHLGVRGGEALGLQWGDINWSKRTVHIARDIDYKVCHAGVPGELKTIRSDRHLPIPDELYEPLASARGMPKAYIFPRGAKPYSKTMFRRAWIELMADAGFARKSDRCDEYKKRKKAPSDFLMEMDPGITPHYLRHNYATMLFEAGVDPLVAMYLLGHASYTTTAQIYTHLNNMHVEKASESVKKMFKGKKVAEKLPER